ncbi:ABC transporter permease subunit [Bacillus sp. CH30_1T]|uniref:ABC transporter permease subunit n=1 Tax=Bacillus sp. CH30_1T TaxID=2604836 RepID=UPI0011EDF31B|nr:ABC transporter permease subunit [Bacillus sp. CH30_1T]KAA0565821.1 ABC transporter permease subunit [Bacillus sp. CH30_1T]
MFKLVKNEWYKNFFRIRNYVSLLFILFFSIITVLLPTFFSSQYTTGSYDKDNWKEEVRGELTALDKKYSEADKKHESKLQSDPESMEVMILESEKNEITEEINRLNYYLEQNIMPVSNNNLYDNLLSVTQMTGLITVLITVVAVSLIADEFSSGTIKLLLIRSVSRFKILLSKLITMILYILFYTASAILFTLVISLLMSDINSSSSYVFSKGIHNFMHENFYVLFAQNIVTQLFSIMMVSLIAFSLTVIFISKSVTLPLSLAIYFMAGPMTMFLSQYTDLTRYLWFANWDFKQFLLPFKHTQGPLIEGMTLTSSLLINVLYCIPLLLITFYFFQKKEIYN